MPVTASDLMEAVRVAVVDAFNLSVKADKWEKVAGLPPNDAVVRQTPVDTLCSAGRQGIIVSAVQAFAQSVVKTVRDKSYSQKLRMYDFPELPSFKAPSALRIAEPPRIGKHRLGRETAS